MKVTYIDHMGTDLSVVNAARVSFSKKSKGMVCTDNIKGIYELSKGDQRLIEFLARGCTSGDWTQLNYDLYTACSSIEIEDLLKYVKSMPTHWTPFGHTAITLHLKAPIFVARQLGKHQVGMVWNEVSRRYVMDEPEFYEPDVWRKSAENVKQGSSSEAITTSCVPDARGEYTHPRFTAIDVNELAFRTYSDMLDAGVCAEQARMVLPQSMMTEWFWTGNLYSFANVFIQRSDSHAQREVQVVAYQIAEIIEPLFPISWKALTE